MLEKNKSYEMKEWFRNKFAQENGFSICGDYVFAIMKETEKAVYAMVQVLGAKRKCTWIPKSCLESYEIGDDGICNHHETHFEEDYNKCVEMFEDFCRTWDLV